MELEERLIAIFEPHPQAKKFVWDYITMCHLIDDVVDGEIKDPESILNLTQLQANVYGSEFYRAYYSQLVLVDAIINNSYADSCAWEKSDESWQQLHADVLRHAGCDMLFAVVLIIAGRETLREISKGFREFSHRKHLGDFFHDYKTGPNTKGSVDTDSGET